MSPYRGKLGMSMAMAFCIPPTLCLLGLTLLVQFWRLTERVDPVVEAFGRDAFVYVLVPIPPEDVFQQVFPPFMLSDPLLVDVERARASPVWAWVHQWLFLSPRSY